MKCTALGLVSVLLLCPSAQADQGEVIFECFFFSVLNFSFFGFGDVTPQTIPAKVVTMMEVILAFFTVIFLLSDFISLKDSIRAEKKQGD